MRPFDRIRSNGLILSDGSEKPGKKRPVLNLQPCVMDSCLFGAESSLRLLAGTHQLSAIPQAPEHLRFDAWPRHWSMGLKTGQNRILSYPVKKTAFANESHRILRKYGLGIA